MAVIEEALYSRLSGHAGLQGVIGNPVRVYDVQTVPQSPTLPFVTYQRLSGRRESAMGADVGVVSSRFQTTAWSNDYGNAKTVKEQLRAALQRWRGTELGVEILDTFIENDLDIPFEFETQARGAAIDVMIAHRE